MKQVSKRILYISKYARSPYSGGYSRQYLISKRLVENGNYVQLVSSRSNGVKYNKKFIGLLNKVIEDKLEIITVNGPIVNLGFNLKRLWSWLLFEMILFISIRKFYKYKPDVIIVSSLSILTFVFGVCLKKHLRIPLILEIRDLYPLTLMELGGMSRKNPIIKVLKWIEKYGYVNADLLISSLENTKEYFEQCTGRSVLFKWIPNGLDENIYVDDPDKESLKIIKHINELKSAGKFIIGYSGTFGKANALDEIFALTNYKSIRNANIHFIFIGDGPKKDSYQKNFNNCILTFFDRISRKYLHLVLKECDVLINTWLKRPIYYYGISPNKWIDYMYAGRPILLALDAKSNIFNEAKCGWQIESQNIEVLESIILKIRRISKEELNNLGLNGKNYLQNKLSYNLLSRELEGIIDMVCKKV